MKKKSISYFIIILFILAGCGGGGGSSSNNSSNNSGNTSQPATPTTVPAVGKYITINMASGSNSICTYNNAPCVSVSICQPGTTNCQVINNIAIDSGSFGLRVFGSLIPSNILNNLPYLTSGSNTVAECVTYGDGSANWGPIQFADVNLGGITASSIPIQIINSNYQGASKCTGAATSPNDFMLNGILGVGTLTTDQNFSPYYSCTSSNCNLTIPSQYVQNPITALGTNYNNGITFHFGSIPNSGAYNANGYAIFGVGNNVDNTPSSTVSVFKINTSNGSLNVNSTFQGQNNSSFLDTGSQYLFFSNSTFLPLCSNSLFFCPTAGQFVSETATMSDINGFSSSGIINFSIGNTTWLLNSSNTAFATVAYTTNSTGNIIGWGMPFFYGRTVYMVFAGNSITVNNNTYNCGTYGCWIY
ncbi:MAG TPA: DUF3443 family protein [Burkholderiales bacterium]|nr:DUF3443 family protein [Burkholderiales bacterium]